MQYLLVGLVFVVGRQSQLLLFDERTTDPRFFSVYLARSRFIYDRITVSNPTNFHLINLVLATLSLNKYKRLSV
jgi:hypothetical protein